VPYSSVDELPDRIRKLPEKKARQWMHVWNSAFARTKDEGRAFAMANAAIAEEQEEEVTTEPEAGPVEEEPIEALSYPKLAGVSEQVLLESQQGSVIGVTLIKPGWSTNGRYYSPSMLKDSANLFEGSLAFVNHPTRSESRERPGRDVRDLVGFYEGVHFDNGLKANLHLIGKNGAELQPIISEAVRKPDLIGLSINAAGNVREGLAEGKRGQIVENFVAINSTDIVTKPSAGGQFERLMASEDWVQTIIEETSFQQWQSHHPEWTPKEVVMTEDLKEQIASAVQEANKPLQERIDAQEREIQLGARRESARSKLEASQVPTAVRSDLLEQVAALEETDQDAFIERQVEMFRKLNIRPLVTGNGQGGTVEPTKLSEEVASKVLGINVPMVKPGESVWEYRDRMRGQG
jgi:hypothetical protein